MSLMKYEPWSLLEQMRQEMQRTMDLRTSGPSGKFCNAQPCHKACGTALWEPLCERDSVLRFLPREGPLPAKRALIRTRTVALSVTELAAWPTNSNVATSDWVPAVDIKEDEKEFVILADIPGVDPKDIEVHMDNGALTIKGSKTSEKKDEHEGYKRVERSYGSFYRRFSLPDTADPEKIAAHSDKGVLEVRIGKHEKTEPRRISVNG